MALREGALRPCKLGTVPSLVVVHGSDIAKIEPGRYVRVRERDGVPWERVLVRKVNPDGYFQADRF